MAISAQIPIKNLVIPAGGSFSIASGATVTGLPAANITAKVTVADQTARYLLTTASVQNGDYVFQTDTSVLYEVTDQTALNGAGGYTALATVAWGSVTGKPEHLIEDAAGSIAEDTKQYARKDGAWVEVVAGAAAPESLTPDANVKFGAAAGAGITDVLPAAPAAGDRAKYYIKPTGDKTLDFATAILKPTDSGLSLPKTMTSGKTYVVLMEYNGTAWMLISLVGGY